MPFCTHCSARIPAGHRYCHPHHQAVLRAFTHRQARFQQARAEWMTLTPLQRAARHRAAEVQEVTVLAGAAGLLLGGTLWQALAQRGAIDGPAGLCLLLLATGLCAQWDALRHRLGRAMRALVVAAPGLLVAALALLGLALLSGLVARHWQGLALLASLGVIGHSLWREYTGAHHVNAEPRPPAAPQP